MQQPKIKHSVPAYVRYQRPPVVGPLDPLILSGGERLEGEIKYYDYGVVSVIYQLAFSGDWESARPVSPAAGSWDIDFAARVRADRATEDVWRANAAIIKALRPAG